MKNKKTMICVDKDVRDMLKKMRMYKRETHQEVIKRLIDKEKKLG